MIRLAMASKKDIPSLMNLEQECFSHQDAFNRKQFLRAVLNTRNMFFILYEEETKNIVGYCYLLVFTKTVRIYSICISKNYHRQGFASELLDFIEKSFCLCYCEKIILEVKKTNRPAISLYQKSGYKQYGIRHNYYADCEDAILMKKDIKMPFKSQAQERFMFAKKPKLAKEFAAETTNIKNKLNASGYPYYTKNYREAHEEADNAEKRKYPKAYKNMKKVDKKLGKNELSGKNLKSGKIEISSKVPAKDRKDVALHERTEHLALKRLAKKHKLK